MKIASALALAKTMKHAVRRLKSTKETNGVRGAERDEINRTKIVKVTSKRLIESEK